MKEIRLDWKEYDDQEWAKLFDKVPRSNIFQHAILGRALAQTEKMSLEQCLIYRGNKPIGLAQLIGKRIWLGFKSMRLIRGPLFFTMPSSQEMIQSLKLIKARYPLFKGCWCSLQPELPDSDATQSMLQTARFNKVITGYSSAWLDLRADEKELRQNLHGKWRNQLAKAEKAGLVIQESLDHNRLLDRHEKHIQEARFSALSSQSYSNLPEDMILHLEARKKDETIAELLILLHGSCATYQISWTNEGGKETSAVNLLLWQAILALKTKGIRNLDLGGIDPIKNPGLARFKERLGGEPFTLAGTYI